MLTLDILILGLALAIDAAVATFALGVLGNGHSRTVKIGGAFYLAGLFGFFQFLMLWLGSRAGFFYMFSDYGHMFQLAIAGIFLLIGAKIMIDTFKNEDKKISWGLLPTVLVAIATSIDALAAGVSLGAMPETYLSALEVGGITFTLCLMFYFLSQVTTKIPDQWLQRFSGLTFLIMGIKVIFDYLRLGGM